MSNLETQFNDFVKQMEQDHSSDTIAVSEYSAVLYPFMAGDTPSTDDAVRLFRRLYDPRALVRTNTPSYGVTTSTLAPVTVSKLLNCLDGIYQSYYHRTVYEPDNDDAGAISELLVHLHVVATRAFAIKQAHTGSYEEVESCLSEAERTYNRIQVMPRQSTEFDIEMDIVGARVSASVVYSLVSEELCRIRLRDGRSEDAVGYLAQAVMLDNSSLDNLVFDTGYSFTWPIADIDGADESRVSLEEAKSLVQSLKADRNSVVNWHQIAEDCRVLSNARSRRNTESEFWPKDTDDLTWSDLWHRASGWASAQLSPSEYRKMREDDEKYAAETRLKNYFFGRTWSYLPERAQQRLINADLIWNSLQHVSREAILNELLRVAEEMCEHFMVQPLVNDSPDILSIEAKMAERRRSLGVRDYIDICEIPSLPSLLSERSLADGEIRFLIEDLPASMRSLARARNPAEHETGTSTPPALVDSAYRLFLGIGRKGILPQLARIGRKLQGRRH